MPGLLGAHDGADLAGHNLEQLPAVLQKMQAHDACYIRKAGAFERELLTHEKSWIVSSSRSFCFPSRMRVIAQRLGE